MDATDAAGRSEVTDGGDGGGMESRTRAPAVCVVLRGGQEQGRHTEPGTKGGVWTSGQTGGACFPSKESFRRSTKVHEIIQREENHSIVRNDDERDQRPKVTDYSSCDANAWWS